jgi:hypothetical protein
MDPRTHAVTWLVNCDEPAIRLMTRRDVLGEQADDDAGQVLAGAKVTALLSGQRSDGGFGVHPYRKWTGAHWRAGLPGRAGHPPREPRAVAAAGHVLAWLASPRRRVPRIGGLTRARASIEGNALAACCRLGLAAGPRVRSLAGSLILAMARWRVELRPGRHRAALLLPRVAGPGLGTARVRAGHRRSGRQGRGQPHRRAVPGPPDRQVS